MRDWKVPPGDVWDMSLEEWFWMFNGSLPSGGRLTAQERAECMAVFEEN